MAKKKKAVKKQAKKVEDADEDIELPGDDGGEIGNADDADFELSADADGLEDEESDDLDELEEDEEPPKKQAAEKDETAQSRKRRELAEKRANPKPKIKDQWYEFKRGPTYNAVKGLKLIRVTLNKHGAVSEFIGWEKKMPKSFLKKLKAENLIREHKDK